MRMGYAEDCAQELRELLEERGIELTPRNASPGVLSIDVQDVIKEYANEMTPRERMLFMGDRPTTEAEGFLLTVAVCDVLEGMLRGMSTVVVDQKKDMLRTLDTLAARGVQVRI